MVEKWLEVHILFSQYQISDFRIVKTILLEVVKYCVYELRRKGLMNTYHYFFEPRVDKKPGLEVLFRVEAKEDVDLSNIENLIVERIEHFRSLIDDYVINKSYQGEIEGYGKDGWMLAKKFFEIGSDIALAIYSEDLDKREKFNPGKLIHCLLNQLALIIKFDEERFYALQLVGRAAIALHTMSVTPEVAERARMKLEEAIGELKGRTFRIL